MNFIITNLLGSVFVGIKYTSLDLATTLVLAS